MAPWRIKAMKASKQRVEPVATKRGPQMAPKVAPKSYATAVSRNLPHQLSVHLGTEERTFMDEATFTTLMEEMEKRTLAADTKEVPPIWCAYTRWAGGRGLLGCLNQATADYIRQTIAGIKIDGKSFKAWCRGEQGRLARVTFYTPALSSLPAGKAVMDQLIHQNELPGTYVIPSFKEVRSKD